MRTALQYYRDANIDPDYTYEYSIQSRRVRTEVRSDPTEPGVIHHPLTEPDIIYPQHHLVAEVMRPGYHHMLHIQETCTVPVTILFPERCTYIWNLQSLTRDEDEDPTITPTPTATPTKSPE